MKNLLLEEHKAEILARIDSLKPSALARWGKMNVNQSMRHMAMAFDISYGILNPTMVKAPPMPKWLLKFFLLNMKPPKGGAETFLEMNMVENKLDPADFEAEKANLKKAVERFS